MSTSNTKAHGLIIAIDDYYKLTQSRIRLFYDADKVARYIKHKQKGNDEFFIVGGQPYESFKQEMGGIKSLEVPYNVRDTKHLRHAIEERQRLGSHDAYIQQVREETRQTKRDRPKQKPRSHYGWEDYENDSDI